MNIVKRTCASCAAFNPSATDDEEVCGNLVNIIIHHVDEDGKPLVIHRQPYAGFRCDSHQTHEEDEAETREIEVTRHLAQATPEFMNASRSCLELRDTLGEEHPETQKALALAMSLVPPSMNAFMADTAKELGLMPDADGYTDDGEPVFSLESIAAKLDIGMDEAKQAMDAMLADREAMGPPAALVDPATVHRKH